MSAVMLFDVDGTLSPLPLPGWDNDTAVTLTYTDGEVAQVSSRWAPFARPGWSCAHAGAGPMPFRPELIARINAATASGLLAPRWLTTWDESANRLSRLGLTGLPWPVEPRSKGQLSGKPAAVRSLLERNPGVRVVWADDAVDFRLREVRQLRDLHTDRLLIVRPRSTFGLSDTDMDKIEQFADAHG